MQRNSSKIHRNHIGSWSWILFVHAAREWAVTPVYDVIFKARPRARDDTEKL